MGSGDDSTIAAAERPPPSGTPAAHRYDVLDLIGRGGMGEVVEARDRRLERIVALKRLVPGAGERTRNRFEAEAGITARLEHAGIPPVYDRGEFEDGTPFYVMRRIRGRTLEAAIGACKGLDERLRLVPAVISVARTVAFAHQHGVIHRDIKPANVVMSDHGEVFLLDWGIAKLRGPSTDAGADSATRAGDVMGTPAYMAPEQAEGQVDRIDPRTDVFAVGALLYHVLTGRPPYGSAVGVQAITRAAAGEYEPIPRVASDVPLALRQICERAMARDLADRYDSAEDIAQGLERSTALALRTSSTRVEWVAAGITAIATLGVGGAIGGMVSESPPFAAQGPAPYGSMAFTLLAGILAGVEYVTLGRHRLSTLVLGLGLSTAVLALATFGGGLSRMAMHLREVAGPIDPERVLAGVAEAGGSLATGASLAALQLVLWAALRRRSEMRHTS